MSEITGISWTRSTFNPFIGCTKVGPGCDNCYAETLDGRRKFGGTTHWGAGVPRMRTSVQYWKQPLKWDREAAKSGEFWPVFCASLADVFDNEVPNEWRNDLFDLVSRTPHLTWQIVTKRIGNVERMMPAGWIWPRNVWLVATVVNQEEFDRDWPKLRNIPAHVRGLSIEPMLGEVDFTTQGPRVVGNLHWVIYGGESKQRSGVARECRFEWVERGVLQCLALGITPFVKQMGHNITLAGAPMKFTGKGADPAEWLPNLRVQRFPMGAALRAL